MITEGATHSRWGKFSHYTSGLEGKLILDCSMLLPGPFVAKLLWQQGARVIKIENPNRPDPARLMGAFYQDLNGMKELRSIDITSSAGREEFQSLVKQAHGLIEGYRPETKLKLGLDEASLLKINPTLIIGSIVGFPEVGPWRNRAGHDINFQATSGLLSLSHEMPPLPWADLFASYQAALSISALLCSQNKMSSGRRVAVSMTESLIEIQSLLFAQYQQDQRLPTHGSNLFSGGFPCYRIYQTQDQKRLAVGCIEPKFWSKFCDAVFSNTPEKTAALEGQFAKLDEADRISNLVQSKLFNRTLQDWLQIFDPLDCCVEPVLDYSEIKSPIALSHSKESL
jgi:alpha-methylacyl-CoA racemase